MFRQCVYTLYVYTQSVLMYEKCYHFICSTFKDGITLAPLQLKLWIMYLYVCTVCS